RRPPQRQRQPCASCFADAHCHQAQSLAPHLALRSPAARLPLVEQWTLLPDIRWVAVAREDSRLIRQGKELLAQTPHDEREVAERGLGRAGAARKERIAAKELPIAQETDAARRVSGGMQHLDI